MKLSHALFHHAKDKQALALVLLAEYVDTLEPQGWRLMKARKGNGSWMLVHPQRGKQFHFRNGGKGCIRVMDHYYAVSLKRPMKFLRTRVDVIRWVQSI